MELSLANVLDCIQLVRPLIHGTPHLSSMGSDTNAQGTPNKATLLLGWRPLLLVTRASLLVARTLLVARALLLVARTLLGWRPLLLGEIPIAFETATLQADMGRPKPSSCRCVEYVSDLSKLN